MYTGLLQIGLIFLAVIGFFFATFYFMKHPHTDEYKEAHKRMKKRNSIFSVPAEIEKKKKRA